MKTKIRNIYLILASIVIITYIIYAIITPALSMAEQETMALIKAIDNFEGNGTEDSPYIISSSIQLERFAQLVNSGNSFKGIYFQQSKDIDLKNEEFSPIGKFRSNNYFYGTYDGAGHSIYNLKITGDKTEAGNVALFGQLGGTVKNVGIESGEIIGYCVGSIASHAIGNEAKIINCYNKATVKASGRAGGIADNFGKGQIINCWNEGNLEAPETGGISSYTAGSIYNSYCVQEKIMNGNFSGTIRKSEGGYSQSKNELAQKMNNGIKETLSTLELQENSLTEWKGTEESISLKQTDATTKKTTK